MTTAIPGLVKIGKTEVGRYKERMRQLEDNGYKNVTGLKRFFAIELRDYDRKEKLLHDIFSKHRIAKTELFELDKDLLKELLLSFGYEKIIHPEAIKPSEKALDESNRGRPRGKLFSFQGKGLTTGAEINFIDDSSIKATIAGDRDVEYNGKRYKLSALTRKLYTEKGQSNKSGSYRGSQHWERNGVRLKDLPDK